MTVNSATLKPICLDDSKIERADCHHCSIRHRMLFAPLDMAAIERWIQPIKHQRGKAKTRIFQQGQAPHNIFSLRRGFIKLIQVDLQGKEHILRILGPGSCIGLEALLDNRYQHSAEALTDIDYCTIPTTTINQIEQQQPIIYQQLIKHWQLQLTEADNWLANLSNGTSKQRLCRLLIMQAKLQNNPDHEIFLISNQDIASILATSNETISRNLSELRSLSILNKIDRRIYRLDIDAAEVLSR